ncbi:MAG: Nif3-like dinuclear metal center hexameric protein [Bacilli bacterium]|nr:Nif3-like dinuclear metal center hexameric protein [Bacilli bacterium]
MKINEIIKYLEQRFPLELASDFDQDRVGLIIGDYNLELKNLLFSLDLNLEVANEAINREANLIVVHHPFLFHPLKSIQFNSKYGKILKLLFEKQISVYVIHTALDVGKGGVNDTLARMLEIKEINQVIEKDNFIRYGKIEGIFLKELALRVKEKLNLSGLRMAGNPDQVIHYLGVVGGSGGHEEDIDLALQLGIDCYITGEVSLHAGQKAVENGLAILEVNHGVEKFVFISLAEELKEEFNLENQVFVSKVETDPFVTIK